MASSPSSIHYGCYIAACDSDALTAVNILFMVVLFQVGIPLSRWTWSLHCILQKLKRPYATKLRIIQLYEADLITMLKHLLERRIMWNSEEHGVNGHQLFGSRKDKSTYDALITVKIAYDIGRDQWDYLIFMYNELKGCYDRVWPSLNTLTTRYIGLP